MNLLYTLTAYPPFLGGAQLHQHLLAQHLQTDHDIQDVSFWDVHLTDWLLGTTLKSCSRPNDYTIDTVSVHRLGFSWEEKLKMLPWVPLYYPVMSVALPRIAAAIAPHLMPFAASADLIHNVRIGREGLTYASRQVARRRDIPFILTPVHHPRWRGWRYREYDKLYRSADAVIALTPPERRILVEEIGVHPDKVHVTGHGPVLAETAAPRAFRDTYGLQGPMILFLGQHHLYKGFKHVLATAPLIWRHYPDAQFVFMGPAVKASEQVFVDFQDPRIHRLGAVSLQEKTDALAACDVLCVPSSQESFGGVYTEAWGFGKPVIGCNIPAVADVVNDGVNGYLVEQQTPLIADRLLDLLTHPQTARAMGQAGQVKVEACYTWPRLAEKTAQIYQSVCHGR